MKGNAGMGKYVPGTYTKKRASVESRVGHYVREWESQKRVREREGTAVDAAVDFPPSIAFSRKIGTGALEIADDVGRKLDFRVVDRELVEIIADQAQISEKATAFFDERFPGYVNRTFKYLFGEKAFIDSDYTRHLIGAVTAVAGLESTIFVGRGIHLILPRNRVMAVRCICSDKYRYERVANIMGASISEAKKHLAVLDKEQAAFFKKVFNRKSASPYEFDMVLNLDHFAEPEAAADIVVSAFEKKLAGVR